MPVGKSTAGAFATYVLAGSLVVSRVWIFAVDGAALVGVELLEMGRGHRRIALLEAKEDEPCSVFVRNSGRRSNA